ncbi:SDR family oxidoreductase [Prosthecobacter dejongeii]|uniref:NAD(P)-dependent dehydrogenase (Short-subunit alcohol dehydrogenase family) n=1 Tax=Prosthecobacter dejongeii TaxID=48465 RepID=A0A7W7YL63_9BACT|nr:SDR family oxidoreductase [Prosthecobacter dejongeii]MBB5037980.1 NAD(P)-dependent dehydrogenase (short-subunit alcohol dehydrogenase family) [Prosthecobacter dejongeii]
MQSLISKLTNTSVIVTGGSRGYGAGIAEAFVKAGARVWITGRDQERLQTTAQNIGAIPFTADVADGYAWDRLMEEVIQHTGRLDVLVNNAGEGVKVCQASDQTDEAIARSLASNLTGAMLGCRRAAAIMQSQRSGLIINIGSACSTHAWPGWSIYSAAKAGLLMFTRCLLTELRPYGVRVTSVLPSWGQTEFTEAVNLPPRDPVILAQCISPSDLGQLIVQTACMPPHLVAEEIKLWPIVQPMIQL